MIDLKVCPSTLAEGYDTYSPAARKALFDGVAVSLAFTIQCDFLSKIRLIN